MKPPHNLQSFEQGTIPHSGTVDIVFQFKKFKTTVSTRASLQHQGFLSDCECGCPVFSKCDTDAEQARRILRDYGDDLLCVSVLTNKNVVYARSDTGIAYNRFTLYMSSFPKMFA